MPLANELYKRLTSDTFCDILTLGQLDIVCSMLHHRVYPLTGGNVALPVMESITKHPKGLP